MWIATLSDTSADRSSLIEHDFKAHAPVSSGDITWQGAAIPTESSTVTPHAPAAPYSIRLAERRSDLNDFLVTCTLDPIHGTQASAPPDAVVTLITVHSAKGLEGERLVIPQTPFGMYSFMRSFGSEADVEQPGTLMGCVGEATVSARTPAPQGDLGEWS